MNSYSLGISGSIWLLVLAILIGVGLAIWSYRRTAPPISNFKRILLISLRSIALIILLFALFEPVATMIHGAFVKPKIAVILDNSVSAGLEDARIDRKKAYLKAINNSGIMNYDDDKKIFTIFSSGTNQIEDFSPDSLNFTGQMTDISQAIRWINDRSEEENIQAAMLVTDGSFNAGNNPVYDAERFGKPIYVIGIGDSTEPKDVYIESIITNEIAYLENPVPINVNLSATGYDDATIELKLFDNGNEFASQEIKLHPDKMKYTSFFEYMPEVEGNHKITATVKPLDGELTTKNNQYSEFIKVLKNKRNIAIFAGSPSPDLSFIKKEIMKEKGVEINEYVQKKNDQYYNPPVESEVKEAEIIVLVGFPIRSTPQPVIEMVKRELERGKPVFFIASRDLDLRKLKSLEGYLPFTTMSSRPQEFLALPHVKPEYITNPLLRISGAESDIEKWNSLPPVFKSETFVKPNPGASIASVIKVNNTNINEPLMMTREFQGHKSVAFLGYGLFRWKMLGYAAELPKDRENSEDLFSILIDNSIRWLSVSGQNRQIIVKTTRKQYIAGEQVVFDGQVYDASYTPIDNAVINVSISGGGENVRELMLSSLGNGRYAGSVEGLRQGDYSYNAIVTVNGVKLGADGGRFTIGELNVEYRNIKMNAQLLRNIAYTTKGEFFLPDNANEILKRLDNLKSFKSKGVTLKDEFVLWDRPWLLIITILLLGIEWFIRKKSGLI